MKCDQCGFKSDSMQMFVVDGTKKKVEIKCRPCAGCIIRPQSKMSELIKVHTPNLDKEVEEG